MQQIILKRGLDLPIDGKAECTLGSVNRPDIFRIVPDHYAGITPKLDVKVGDKVKAGSPLFHDKTFAQMLFTSPVSGEVAEIVRGDRRKILSINIKADAKIEYIDFKFKVESLKLKEDVRDLLLQSGLWPLIKQRPYACIALPNKEPQAIFISTFCSAPLAPDFEWVLKGQGSMLQTAISALSQIATVYVGIKAGAAATEFRALKDCVLYEVAGAHPAGNVGVQINHIRPMRQGETIWTIGIQDLALIGKFLATGKVDMQKKVALAGPMAYGRQYYNVLPGMPVSAILKANFHREAPCRMIAGNVLDGKQIDLDNIINPYNNLYTVIAEGSDKHEFMGWMLPRLRDFHFGNTDPGKMLDCKCLRWLFGPRQYQWDARLKGGRRAIIVSGEYDKVFPMDIYPEQLIKAMIALNLDKMIELGASEVAPEDFALCEYVCTSKMPLQAIVREALDYMRKEIE
ncbi:MAG: Na(+)-translocating NADH-quinone reductase subunit A [Paludibacteraceae bacterium]|nr:Na(+)-translocating NADH-quinone reductase subunit A [Paludibacteraceae bacterium]